MRPSLDDGISWQTVVRGLLGLLFAVSLLCTVLAFAYAYPHCVGTGLSNCGMGPALVLFASLVSSGAALVIGALLLLLWQNSPMSQALQRTCKFLSAASAIYLIGCLVVLNL